MNLFALLAVAAVVVASSECFRLDSSEDRIMGGHAAKRGQFPYIASLRIFFDKPKPAGFHHASGAAIISDRWLITSAKYTRGRLSNPANLEVIVGAHHIDNDGQKYLLDRVEHNHYSSNPSRNDIALLHTTIPIEFSDLVKPIPVSAHVVSGGVKATVSGWGDVGTVIGDNKPKELQFLHVTTVTNEECVKYQKHEYKNEVYSGALCTFTPNREGICFGDGGDPLVVEGKLVGVASFRFGCGEHYPNGYTRLSEFVQWIQRVTGVVAV